MNSLFMILMALILSIPPLAFSGERNIDVIEKEFIHNYDATVRDLTASLDFPKEEKIKNLLDSGFAVVKEKEQKRVYALLPNDLHRLIDGKIYCKKDSGLASHYIFFILNPPSWVVSLKALNSSDMSWIGPNTAERSLDKPLILINFDKGISITVTFWEKSPPTCQITELVL